jgi:hypothetical protein
MAYTSPKFNGEPSAAALANGLATLGRYGDSYMVHASDGETLIPGEIFDANPKLKADLFNQMKVMGIRDPNRYVVGNSLNSINPITGQPEFFFKKIFKAVKKIFKTALPYIAPVVGNMIAPGIGGIIASGLVSKLQGGSWEDVAKDMAISYGVGALGRGLQGGFSGQQAGTGFLSGLWGGLKEPFQAIGGTLEGGEASAFNQGIFGPKGYTGLFPQYQVPEQIGAGQESRLVSGQPHKFARSPSDQPVMLPENELQALRQAGAIDQNNVFTEQGYAKWNQYNAAKAAPAQKTQPRLQGEYAPETQLLEDVRSGVGWTTTTDPEGNVHNVYRGEIQGPAKKAPTRWWSSDQAPGGETVPAILGTLAEQAAVPALIAGLTYFLSEDEDELTPEQQRALADPQRNAYDKYLQGRQADPNFKNTPEGQALLAQAGIVPSTDPQTLADATGASLEQAQNFITNMYGNQFTMAGATALGQPLTAPGQAKGGIITLQGGGEIMGPGSGISDSIPARLSDGEFVMTADAVRGAGSGSRDMGAARMYDLMSRFERAA